MSFYSRKAHFLSRKLSNTLSDQIGQESEGKETSNFWPKVWTNPFVKNANYATF